MPGVVPSAQGGQRAVGRPPAPSGAPAASPAKPGGKAQADKPERRRPGTVGGAALPAAGTGSPFSVGQDVEVDIEDVAQGGWCVARPDGLPVMFVRHALPGERVVARVTEVTSKFARADAVEVLRASPDRVSAPCRHARPGGCGGCDWQHASLTAQRALKAAVIDRDPEAFRRLRPSFKGDRVTGIGFDRDVLARAGIERADGFAAVSSGDNSNIIAARVARETFRVQQVAARIYDPRRAEVYERLGIPTVATVRWTADQMLRKLIPESTEPLWRDATGKVVLSQVNVCPDWIGEPVKLVEASAATRIVYIDRLGEAIVPQPGTVLQQGDVVHVIVAEADLDRVCGALAKRDGRGH